MKLINKIALLNIELVKPYTNKYDQIVSGLESESGDWGHIQAILTTAYQSALDCIIASPSDSQSAMYAAATAVRAVCLSDDDNSSYAEHYHTNKAIKLAYGIESTRAQLIELLKGTEYEITEKK